VRELYFKYRDYGSGPIPKSVDMDFSKFDEETTDFLNEIYMGFGQYSAWKLREMTHNEPPWIEANNQGGDNIISHESLKRYFSSFVEIKKY
jgi:uncharacterized phage-associated protein